MRAAPPGQSKNHVEFSLAIIATVGVVLLHLYFLTRVGGLWRDEVNSLNIALGGWQQISHDSFPVMFPTLLHGWAAGFGQSDFSLRTFGIVTGLSLTVASWISGFFFQRAPAWPLALVALNGWVIYYDAELRAYGLGSATIAVCAGTAWNYLQNPSRKRWLWFAIAATLSVQTLYQNTSLVAAICAGGCAVAALKKNFRLGWGIFLGGLIAAISLLPYWHGISNITHATTPVRDDFNFANALRDLTTLLEFPIPRFVWVWLGLLALALFHAFRNVWKGGNELPAFSAVTTLAAVVLYFLFLRFANFFVQPWYFLPPVALAGTVLAPNLPRIEGALRAVWLGSALALILVSAMFAQRVLDYRFTNLDELAKTISASVRPGDYAVVRNWPFGITFGHYFKNACRWNTVPPLENHATHRYDLLAIQMETTNTMKPVLEKITGALQKGNSVWLVGGAGDSGATNVPPPLAAREHNEMVFIANCNNEIDHLLHDHALEIQTLNPGTNNNVNFTERTSLSVARGWKE